jgi:hypothetical protein
MGEGEASDGVPKDNGLDAPWLMGEHGSSHEMAPEDDGPEAPTQPAGSSSASVHVNGGEEWANGSMRDASMSRISFFVSSSRWPPSPVCWSPLQRRRNNKTETRMWVYWCQNLFSELCSIRRSI